MTDDRDDNLLDACLEEVLGGRTPPDLSARIMQALAVRSGQFQDAVHVQDEPLAPPVAMPPVTARAAALANVPLPIPTVNAPAANNIVAFDGFDGSKPLGHATTNWLTIALAIGGLTVALPLGWMVLQYARGKADGVANVKPGDGKAETIKSAPSPKAAGQVAHKRDQKNPAADAKRRSQGSDQDDRPDTEFGSKLPFEDAHPRSPDGSSAIARAEAPAAPNSEVIAQINEALAQGWREQGIKPAAPATDAEWCRRTYLQVIGRIPTVEELKRFTASKSPEKKTELVDRLLTGDAYRDQFAGHWAEYFANVLIGRTAGTGKGGTGEGPASREGLVQYLRQALLSDKSYDDLAFDLLTATGSGQPGSPDYNGAANFLLANLSDTSLNDKRVLATSRTSRVFLGQQLQCAQCHHHPTNDWNQNQFWELNAFFRQLEVQLDRESGTVRLVNRDFRGEGGDPDEADVYYELPSGRMKVAYPAFPKTPALPRSGLVSEVDRRTELARRVVASDELARSAVNRLWAHFLGFGFTRPVDDMGPHNPPSHPALLDHLSQQFAAHDYRLPDLIRWIVLSDAFGHSSKIGTNSLADMPEAGERPLFSRYYTRQMQPEQVYESLQIAAAAPRSPGGGSELEKARLSWLGQFTREMGTDDGEEQNTFNGDIRQSLIMMNGPLMQRAVSHEHGSVLARVSQSSMPFEEKVEHLFLAALARKPIKRELELAAEIQSKRGDAASALQDIWWAVLNSNEFILDH